MHRNVTRALVDGLRLLLSKGEVVASRGGNETRELRSHVVRIERPRERVMVLPERRNNVFAALAETMWVIGGRGDLAYLTRYLPRAGDFSDDGETWRGAYGPRLRDWAGVDQLRECARLLRDDPQTRRAAMMIFDPARDFVQSKDIPCNNWLHFLMRDGRLHLTVALRSNDAIWGFSGINTFEWSVLQEMMARWVGAEVGEMTFMVGSFHLYARHFDRAGKILARAPSRTLYDHGFEAPAFEAPIEALDEVMGQFFALESECRADAEGVDGRIAKVADPFVRAGLQMLRVYNLYKGGAEGAALMAALDRMPTCDLRVAAIDFLTRQKRLRDRAWLTLRPAEEAFFAEYWSAAEDASLEDVYRVLQVLHTKKTRVYGDSWKKHGELLGVFANITRKYDRIESLQGGAKATADEGLIHTLADLAVYSGKYLTWLAEHQPAAFAGWLAEQAGAEAAERYWHNEGLDPIVELLLARDGEGEAGDLDAALDVVRAHYGALERILTSAKPSAQPEVKCRAAEALSLAAARAIVHVARVTPAAWAAFAEEVELL